MPSHNLPRKCVRFAFLLGLAVVLAAPSLWASAFSIAQLGARASGMGTAFVAVADDASAIFFNPAGIAFQPGMSMQMEMLGLTGSFRFFPDNVPAGTVVPEKGFDGFVRPKFIGVANMYLTMPLSPNLTVGFGSFSPFGLSSNATTFEDSAPSFTKHPARFAGTRGRLESIWFQPTVAYKLTPDLAVSLGVAFVHTHLLIEQSFLNPLDDAIDFGRETADVIFPGVDTELAARSIARLLPEGRSRLAATSNSPGFNLGLLYKHRPSKTNFGLMWRSAVVHHLKGEAAFAFTKDYTLEQFVGPDLIPDAFPNQEISGTFSTPGTYAAGIANSSLWDTTISFEFRFQDYRRFADVPVNFTITEDMDEDVQVPAERRLVFNFRDSYHVAMGFEKPLNAGMTVRGGYYYDRNPVIDESVGPFFPDSNRHVIGFGLSRKMGNKEISFFYEAMRYANRKTSIPANANQFTDGEYRSSSHLGGVGLRFIFGEQ